MTDSHRFQACSILVLTVDIAMGKLPKEAQGRGSVCQRGAQMDKALEHQAVAFAHTVYIACVEGSPHARKEKVQIGLNEGCLVPGVGDGQYFGIHSIPWA